MLRAIRSVRYDVTVAGLTIAGIPARKVGASFSSIPQQGKLKALMWTATPSSGTQMCRPTNVPTVGHPEPTAPSGRGLALVEALSSDWGTQNRPGGKTVWFEVRTDE